MSWTDAARRVRIDGVDVRELRHIIQGRAATGTSEDVYGEPKRRCEMREFMVKIAPFAAARED